MRLRVIATRVAPAVSTPAADSDPATVQKAALATLTVADDDLVALAKGENLRDLYMHGRIRIDGDVRVAHKLNFFKGLV